MATIYDIAKAAGVSSAAVSMALNNKKGVSEETRRRILTIAENMKYVANDTAKQLSTQRSKTVVLFVSAMSYEYFNSSFYFDIIKYISMGLGQKLNINIQMSTLDQDAEMIEQLATANKVLAYVFIGTRLSPAFIGKLIGDTPAIFFNKPYALGRNSYSVSFDNQRAAYLLTKYLINLGHRDIAYLGYVPGAIPAENRMIGYKSALEEAGVPLNTDRVFQTEYLSVFGYSTIKDMILLDTPLPSAIICGNDLIAVGAMKALLEFGFQVPGDVSVVGIDNLQFTDMLQVPLTTINVNCEKIGLAIAALLLGISENKESGRHVMVNVSLTERKSAGRYNPNRRSCRKELSEN